MVNRRQVVYTATEMSKARYNMTCSLFQGFQIKNNGTYLRTAVFMWGSLWILYIFEVVSKIVLHKQDVRYFLSLFYIFRKEDCRTVTLKVAKGLTSS
jgi:hypothetical protein